MLASLLIILVSAILLVYWFRYTCLLLLRGYAGAAQPNESRFSFVLVREQLRTEPDLDPLEHALDRDYRMLTYLLKHAANLETPVIQDRILQMDYKLMHFWYRITRTLAPSQARRALCEMTSVVACMSQMLGVQAALPADI